MIYILWAPPRQGKTFVATGQVVAYLLRTNRRVFTNWPVVVLTKDGRILTSRVWSPNLVTENIQSSEIYIDEAYMDYNSREYTKFKANTHTFFATNGHNDNNITLIAQNPARIDVVIREMCNGFLLVKKIAIPDWIWFHYVDIHNRIFSKKINASLGRPLCFNVLNFLTEKDMATRKSENAYSVERIWYDEEIAAAYDTHYFRTVGNTIYEGKTWADELELQPFIDRMNERRKEKNMPKLEKLRRAWLVVKAKFTTNGGGSGMVAGSPLKLVKFLISSLSASAVAFVRNQTKRFGGNRASEEPPSPHT